MNQELDTRACRRLLNEIADLCEHASLTGSMASGARRTAERYNVVLQRLIEADEVPADIFTVVPDDADFGEVGVEARMLAGALSRDDKHKNRGEGDDDRRILVRLAPFIGQAELRDLVKQHALNGAHLDVNTITALAPFLGQEYLSEIVRENLLRREVTSPRAEPPSPPSPSEPPTNTTPVPLEPNEQGIGHLLDMLQDPSLPDRERQQVIERIRIATG
jgi:hypothetical protein